MGAPGFVTVAGGKNTRAARKRAVRGGRIRNVFNATLDPVTTRKLP